MKCANSGTATSAELNPDTPKMTYAATMITDAQAGISGNGIRDFGFLGSVARAATILA